MPDLDALTCNQHGWLSHFAAHEAGHATAAVLLGFEFVEVSIAPGSETYRAMMYAESVVGAGVLMATNAPSEWVAPRPDDALVYLLAGSLTERAFFDHFLPGGYTGDVEMWLRGIGKMSGLAEDEARDVLIPAQKRATALINENRGAVVRVFETLVGAVPTDGVGRHLGFTHPLVVPYDKIRVVVAQA